MRVNYAIQHYNTFWTNLKGVELGHYEKSGCLAWNDPGIILGKILVIIWYLPIQQFVILVKNDELLILCRWYLGFGPCSSGSFTTFNSTSTSTNGLYASSSTSYACQPNRCSISGGWHSLLINFFVKRLKLW